MHNNFKKILQSRFLVNLEKRQFAQSANFLPYNFFSFFLTVALNDNILKQLKRRGHRAIIPLAHRHAFKNPDFIRSAVADELF